MFSFSLMKHIPKGVLSSQPELCFPIKCAGLHLGRPMGAPKSSWQMSWISHDAEFCCFLFSCIQCQPSDLYWLLSVNQFMPRHEAEEEPRASGFTGGTGWMCLCGTGHFSVTGSIYPGEFSPSCVACLLYTQCNAYVTETEATISAKSERN